MSTLMTYNTYETVRFQASGGKALCQIIAGIHMNEAVICVSNIRMIRSVPKGNNFTCSAITSGDSFSDIC